MTSPYDVLIRSSDGYTKESVDEALKMMSRQLSRSESERIGLLSEISRLSEENQEVRRRLDIAMSRVDRSVEQRFSSIESMNRYAFTDRPAICDGVIYRYDGSRWVAVDG